MLPLILPATISNGDYCSFSDESDLTSRYLVIGGVACGTSFLAELDDTLNEFYSKMPYRDRLEWKNITSKNQHVFEEIIDWFCSVNSEHLVDFHALIVDMHRFDHKTHNDGDKETSFDKMLFQSFYAIYKRYPSAQKIRCFHGNKDCRHPFGTLRGMLNAKVNAGRISGLTFPFAEVKLAAVKDTLLLQLADLLIGCVGFHWNNRKGSRPDSSKAKIANRFQSECPARKLSKKTPFAMSHFDIWEFRV